MSRAVVVLIACLLFIGCESRPVSDAVSVDEGRWFSPLAGNERVEATLRDAYLRRVDGGFHVLVLSGGGANGAWGAGVLNGWSSRPGGRPRFDVVAGVSTGALLSTFAFLGESSDDEVLRQSYTEVSREDILDERNLWNVPFSSSLAKSDPLRSLIDRWVKDDVIDRVAAEGRSGRLLLVGTTNLDRGSCHLWDMTELAMSGRTDRYARFRSLLLASASFPILMPPVYIDGEMHTDGAVRGRLFAGTIIGTVGSAYRQRVQAVGVDVPRPGVHLIVNGKVGVIVRVLEDRILDISKRALSLLLDDNLLATVHEARDLEKILGIEVRVAAIPDDYTIGDDPSTFDRETMNGLFERGCRYGCDEW